MRKDKDKYKRLLKYVRGKFMDLKLSPSEFFKVKLPALAITILTLLGAYQAAKTVLNEFQVEEYLSAVSREMPLSDMDAVGSLLDDYGADTRYISKYGDHVSSRLIAPPDGKPHMINVNFETNEVQKEAIESAFYEYNRIFSVINPNYHFQVNFNPTGKEKQALYSTNMYIDDQCVDKSVREASAHSHNGSIILNKGNKYEFSGKICFKKETTEQSYNVFKKVVQHEFGHTLGLDDDYLLDDPYKNTVMSDAKSSISTNDVKILDSLYRDPQNQLSDNEIKSFVLNYDSENIQYEFNIEIHEQDILKCIEQIQTPSIAVLEKQLSIEGIEFPKNAKVEPVKAGEALSYVTYSKNIYGESQALRGDVTVNIIQPQKNIEISNTISYNVFNKNCRLSGYGTRGLYRESDNLYSFSMDPNPYVYQYFKYGDNIFLVDDESVVYLGKIVDCEQSKQFLKDVEDDKIDLSLSIQKNLKNSLENYLKALKMPISNGAFVDGKAFEYKRVKDDLEEGALLAVLIDEYGSLWLRGIVAGSVWDKLCTDYTIIDDKIIMTNDAAYIVSNGSLYKIDFEFNLLDQSFSFALDPNPFEFAPDVTADFDGPVV